MRGSVGILTLGLLAWIGCFGPQPVQAGKVLALPVDGSHWLSMKILVKELIQRGHDVLVLVPETSLLIKSSENYRTEIYQVPYSKEDLDGSFQALKDGLFLKPPSMADLFVNVGRLVNFTTMQVTGCESLLRNQPLMTRLREQGFEAVLTDPFLPCGSIVSHLFNIPAVYFLRGLPCELDSKANQCPAPPSYVPGNSDVMTFPQRVKNMLMYLVQSYLCNVMYHEFDRLVTRHMSDIQSYRELISRGAFWLLRYDFTFEHPKPVMPNTAFIGGINCAKKAPLPAVSIPKLPVGMWGCVLAAEDQDLEEFVNGSGDDGFIVFTLGSMVDNMPEEKAKQFFDAFAQIPQRVLWRYNGAVPENAPKNVKVMKWLPQNDLLAHPKAKVFITHGGIHGIYEGICNGVPMLMFPLFGDQIDNVPRMIHRGVAETLSIYDVTSQKLVARLRKWSRTRAEPGPPVAPLDLAVFWTEFVMSTRCPAPPRSRPRLNWFQYHSLDIFCFLAVVLLTVLWVLLKCCSCCARRCLRIGKMKKE
uniref:UDP-glucuronosyltransferase n=1 Tax=Tetraodon nigroviridis TaxID=99883 RepID=H3CEN3_TETNG